MKRPASGPASAGSPGGGQQAGGDVAELQAWIETRLAVRLPEPPACPARLAEALRYCLLGGGKRLRPVLCALVCRELGGELDDAEPAAVALEMLHTYSLVHDDLPAMDDDDLRRGRATCHKVYGEALAILAGDALQTLAFEVLSEAPRDAAGQVAALARAAGAAGMAGGQVLDLEPLEREPGVAGVRDMHARKTAALFGAAAELGARSAGAADGAPGRARAFGVALGLAFQAVDDVLDVTADAATLGKTPGKDAALERESLVGHLGLDGARAEAAAATEEARRRAFAAGLDPAGPTVALLERLLSRGR